VFVLTLGAIPVQPRVALAVCRSASAPASAAASASAYAALPAAGSVSPARLVRAHGRPTKRVAPPFKRAQITGPQSKKQTDKHLAGGRDNRRALEQREPHSYEPSSAGRRQTCPIRTGCPRPNLSACRPNGQTTKWEALIYWPPSSGLGGAHQSCDGSPGSQGEQVAASSRGDVALAMWLQCNQSKCHWPPNLVARKLASPSRARRPLAGNIILRAVYFYY